MIVFQFLYNAKWCKRNRIIYQKRTEKLESFEKFENVLMIEVSLTKEENDSIIELGN